MCPYSVLQFVILLLIQLATLSNSYLHPLSDEFIELINSKQNLWTAGRNFDKHTNMSYIKKLAGTIIDKTDRLPIKSYTSIKEKHKLPKKFDARREWHYCPSIRHIRDQGACSSCWAVAPASAMTDRICINSNGAENFYFSDDDLLSCCKECGVNGDGCNGGILTEAWLYYNNTGVVSGGSYDSNQGCKPYEIPPCEHKLYRNNREPCGPYTDTPKCVKKCNNNYKIKYKQDKHKGSNVYRVKSIVKEIRTEIFFYGSVSAVFHLYEDFLHYKDGIYQHTEGRNLGYHSVKLIGWGRNNGVKYWLAANTWNADWGLGGFFKIISGSNHCGIEDNVLAGKPQVYSR